MYDKQQRVQDYYELILYAAKEQGIEQGIEKGKLETFISLVQEGLLTKEQASEKLGIPVSELEKYL